MTDIKPRYISHKLWYRTWISVLVTLIQYWKEVFSQCNMSRIRNDIIKIIYKEEVIVFVRCLTIYTRKFKNLQITRYNNWI